ncbi:MAG: SpoIIE family protein phosphatase, partial [Thermoflexibacter sp.]|nr:SpoIIE family protein phosphatase [Thermoflexibacter sp.]
DYQFNHIIYQGNGKFYIGDWAKGLISVNINTKQIKTYPAEIDGKLELAKVLFQGMYLDTDGSLWIATKEGGLTLFDTNNETFTFYKNDANNPQSISSNRLLAMQVNEDNLWLATENIGISIFDKKTKTFSHLKSNPNNPNSLNDNSIWSIYRDKQGRMWAGTYSNGVNIWDKREEKFPKIDVPLKNKVVNALLKDSKDRTWLGTEGGLVRIDKDGRITYYEHDPKNPKSLGSNPILAVVEDKKGRIWIGTWIGGLNLFSEDTNDFIRFYDANAFPHSLANNSISYLLQSKYSNTLFIGTFNGLSIIDIEKPSEFLSFRMDRGNPASITENFITAIFEDSQKRVWIGTNNGLNLFDTQNKKFTRFQNDSTKSKSLIHNNINGIDEDKYGNLWIATQKGLDCMRAIGEFSHYGLSNGLKNDVLNGVLVDEQNNIWVSSNKGISVLNTQTNKFRNYDESDGLQSKQFKPRSFYKDDKGFLYFGGVKGANRFLPSQIKDNPEIPTIVLTDLKLFNKSVQIGEYDSLLKNSIWQTKEITLTHEKSVFTIDFVALSFTQSSKNQYAYKLEGFEKEWNYVGTQRSATYTNLDAGTYTFQVKASNNDGLWHSAGISLKILILPPWWETWWFRIAVVFLLGLSTFNIYKIRTRFLKKQNLKLERQVLERTEEIAKKRNELEFANREIKTKNEELLANEEELRQNMEELEMNQEELRTQKEKLEFAFQELHKQNTKVNDSIRYAERIQQSILPHENILQTAFSEHFVIYKPKDVVSGDFYWYFEIQNRAANRLESKNLELGMNTINNEQLSMTNEIQNEQPNLESRSEPSGMNTEIRNEMKQPTIATANPNNKQLTTKKFLAVVDCTGHGVPGAMMSMIGSTLLKEIIETKQIYEPSKILTELNINLVESFNRRTHGFEDGMDIGLCSIESINSQEILIKYSGARRPLYYFDTQLHKIQGDRFSIGKRHLEVYQYKQHEFRLPKEKSMLYLTSDGWVDTINPERVRYGSKRLTHILQQVTYLPCHAQKAILLQDLENYNQETEQRDDILMVGIRI